MRPAPRRWTRSAAKRSHARPLVLAVPPHELETRYGLTASELLDAINRRFRAKVTLEGAVAEVHLGKILCRLKDDGAIADCEEHDRDGYPDCTIRLPGGGQLTVECKTVRDAKEGYRTNGELVAYKVEVQKTRTSNDDPSSRLYDIGYFDILAVCLGKKTGRWADFLYVRSRDLVEHQKHPGKLRAIQRVPMPERGVEAPWYRSLHDLLGSA